MASEHVEDPSRVTKGRTCTEICGLFEWHMVVGEKKLRLKSFFELLSDRFHT